MTVNAATAATDLLTQFHNVINEHKEKIQGLEKDLAHSRSKLVGTEKSITAYRDKVKKATNTDEVEQYGSLIKNYESSLQHQKKDIAAIEREMKRQNAELGELQKREKRKKQDIEKSRRQQQHKQAYKKAIKGKCTLKIRPVRFNHVGLPRSGKTSFRRRLMGEIENILKAIARGEYEQPSTGVAEDGGQVIIRSMFLDLGTIQSKAEKVWSVLKDLGEEANMLSQFVYQAVHDDTSSDPSESAGDSSLLDVNEMSDPPQVGLTATTDPPSGRASVSPKPSKKLGRKLLSLLKKKLHVRKSSPQPVSTDTASPQSGANEPSVTSTDEDIEETFSIIREAMEAEEWDTIRYLLDDIILLINTDTGGQAEFLDLQASLVQGPSFNLLFSRLVDGLDSLFQIYYTNEEGVSTEKEDSTMTVEEVLFQALSSIACFSGCFSDCDNESSDVHKKLSRDSKSKVMFVGTHRDKVSEEEFERKDQLLQQSILNTEFYDKGIIEFASEDQLMLAVNNMSGGQDEIDRIRKVLENIIEKSFEKIDIPASWLMLSLYIRKLKVRTMSLKYCEELAAKFRISPQELQDALWFLHHCIGVLLYYPEIEELKGTVICEMQVVFDSASNLIKNTFTFDNVGKSASEKFREKAQFSLTDMKMATSDHTDDLIPLEKLVKLLEHRSILTAIPPKPLSEGACTQEPNFFMPSVLRSARASDLHIHATSNSDPAPLLLRYDCGYVPIGVFPALITNLVSQQLEGWKMIEKGLCKNRVQFFVGDYYDTVTLISHPRYFEFAISRSEGFRTSTKSLCAHVRTAIQSTLTTVTSHMNYHFSMGYKFGFECPTHPGREHLCVLAKETAKKMECLQNPKEVQPVPLEPRHQVWFPDPTPLTLALPSNISASGHEDFASLLEDLPLPSEEPDSPPYQPEEPFSMGAKPKLHNLVGLQVGSKQLKVVQNVGVDWKQLGLALEFDYNVVKAIERDTHFVTKESCLELLNRWLNGEACQPITWARLIQALKDAEHSKIATQLEHFLMQ